MQAQQATDNRHVFLRLGVPLVLSLVVSIAWVLSIIDIEFFSDRLNEQWLHVIRYATLSVFGLGIIKRLNGKSVQEALRGPLKFFIAVNIIGVFFLLINIYNLNRYFDSFFILIPISIASILVSMLLAIAYFSLAKAVKKSDTVFFRGYQRPLVLGLYISAFFQFFIVYKAAIALSLIFVIAIIIAILAASTQRFSRLDISGKKYVSIFLVIAGLIMPFAAYGKAPLQVVGLLGAAVGTVVASIFSDFTNNDNNSYTSSSPRLGAEKIEIPSLKKTPIFNDQWLLSKQNRLAVNADYLMRSADGGKSWQPEKILKFYGETIQFDQSGQRGWVGDRYSGMELTEDGGKSWRELTPELAYKAATGKKLIDNSIHPISRFHLDPVTGAGSITIKCSYYFTTDFAHTWEARSFVKNGGDKACLLDTPFSVDTSLNLVLVKGFLREQLFRYDENQDGWEAICDLSGSEFGLNYCSEDESLTEAERLFATQERHKSYFYGDTRPIGSSRELITRFGEHKITNMLKAPNVADDLYWFADQGYLVTSDSEGEDWNIEHDIRQFDHMLPASAEVAYAWNSDKMIWISKNSGNTWQRLFNDEPFSPLDTTTTDNGTHLWLLYPTKMVRINTQSQEHTIVHSWQRPSFTQLRSADNGRVLWAFHGGGEFTTASFDAGETWHEFQAGKVQTSQSGQWSIAAVQSMFCISDLPTCFILKNDSTVSEITLKQDKLSLIGPNAVELPTLGDEDYDNGYVDIAANPSGDQLVIVPVDGRQVVVSEDRGLSWTKTSVGSQSDWWNPIDVSGNGKTMALMRDRGLSISVDYGKNWHLAKFDIDDYYDWRYCWSHDAKTIIVVSEEYMALSKDGGTNWAEYDSEQLYQPWCGIGNDLLWLKKSDIEISTAGPFDE